MQSNRKERETRRRISRHMIDQSSLISKLEMNFRNILCYLFAKDTRSRDQGTLVQTDQSGYFRASTMQAVSSISPDARDGFSLSPLVFSAIRGLVEKSVRHRTIRSSISLSTRKSSSGITWLASFITATRKRERGGREREREKQNTLRNVERESLSARTGHGRLETKP